METQEEIPYCSTSTSSGKQKKARSTSQPQFRSENTTATLEADQVLLALQQLATNSNSANFNNNISRISELLFCQQDPLIFYLLHIHKLENIQNNYGFFFYFGNLFQLSLR